jgi:branched-chain amino acid transport system ATP-binding protein
MLEVRALDAWWGPAQVLFQAALTVQPGELVVLQGLNGAGKSSLLQAIMGLGPRARGSVNYQGQSLSGTAADVRARAGLGYVPENRRLFSELTVQQNLLLAVRGRRDPAALQEPLRQVLSMFPGLQPALQRQALQLSGGEQQMLAIARTLMTSPSMLLLDEPCEGIAPVLVESIRDALLNLKRQGMPMLIAEQNALLADHADRVITLTAGQLSGAKTT